MQHKIKLSMIMKDFIELVQAEKLSNIQVKSLLDDAAGESIGKNIISSIYIAAGFHVVDPRKRIIEPTEHAQYNMTLKDAINQARSIRKEKEKSNVTKPIKQTEKKSTYVVVEAAKETPSNLPVESEFVGRTYSNLFPVEHPEEAQQFILSSLGLTVNELESIKSLIQLNSATNSNESIYESIKQLGSRERKNKTYYISTEIIDRVAAFTEDKNVRVSEFIEVALLEAMKKYQ